MRERRSATIPAPARRPKRASAHAMAARVTAMTERAKRCPDVIGDRAVTDDEARGDRADEDAKCQHAHDPQRRQQRGHAIHRRAGADSLASRGSTGRTREVMVTGSAVMRLRNTHTSSPGTR